MHFSLTYVLWIFFSISYLFSIHVECNSWEPNNEFKGSPLNLRYRPIAININTKNVQKISTPIPILLTGTVTAATILVNTGKSVQTINQVQNDGNVTRGNLKDDFIYLNFNYYWGKSDYSEITGTTIDGKGVPYEVRVLWRNSKYNKISEAIKHKDGLLELVLIYDIYPETSPPNLLFQEVSDKIKQIQNAGSFTLVTLMTQIKAANFIPLHSPYYTYLGSFLDTSTGKKYKCSTVIVIKPNPLYRINKIQFDETFGSIKNFHGKSYTNIMKRDSTDVEVSEAFVVTQKFLF